MAEIKKVIAKRRELRDELAAAALTGLLAQVHRHAHITTDKTAAIAAYEQADAMMEEREK